MYRSNEKEKLLQKGYTCFPKLLIIRNRHDLSHLQIIHTINLPIAQKIKESVIFKIGP